MIYEKIVDNIYKERKAILPISLSFVSLGIEMKSDTTKFSVHFIMICSIIAGFTETKVMQIGEKTILKVAPYPVIPDSVNDEFKSLLNFIENQFESAYPNVDLQLRPMSDTNGFYDLSKLREWLSSNGDGYDVVEIDTILLGDLVSAGLISPQIVPDDKRIDWHASISNVVEVNQATYGYPHLLCATFLFTRDENVAQATTIDQLVMALGNIPSDAHRLVGNLDSSWDLPYLWISSHQNSVGSSCDDVTAFALHGNQNLSYDALRKLARLCDRIPNENQCLDGTFRRDPNRPALLFASKQAKAMFGYSERLFLILKNGSDNDYRDIRMTPLQTGTANNFPLFTMDAYVFRRNMSAQLLEAAKAFAEFMATPYMQAAIVASGDSPYPNPIPRYLLPISMNAYNEPLLIKNRFYQEYFRDLNGPVVPTTGFYNVRTELKETLLKQIQ